MFINSLILLCQQETVFSGVLAHREMLVFQVIVFPLIKGVAMPDGPSLER